MRIELSHFLLRSLLVVLLILSSCKEKASSQDERKVYKTTQFKSYWYAGKAEINSYTLNQSRYGENRKGEAVLIFVTEDFSKKDQVKLDDPSVNNNDKVSVMKLNFTKNFITGIYPYAMMQSIFTPVARDEYPNTLKTTMSSQEWCGQVFTQLNLEGNNYNTRSFSYFQQEGDEIFKMKKVLLEDEIWNIIRINPSSLPTGKIEVIPSLFFTRLNHASLSSQTANASLKENTLNYIYSITYQESGRKISIEFTKEFPFSILGWKEEFNEQGKLFQTSAKIKKTLHTDYWTKNKSEFLYLRDSLSLSFGFR